MDRVTRFWKGATRAMAIPPPPEVRWRLLVIERTSRNNATTTITPDHLQRFFRKHELR